jgi:hypothetical protein
VDVSSLPLVHAAATPETTSKTAMTLVRDMSREDTPPTPLAVPRVPRHVYVASSPQNGPGGALPLNPGFQATFMWRPAHRTARVGHSVLRGTLRVCV